MRFNKYIISSLFISFILLSCSIDNNEREELMKSISLFMPDEELVIHPFYASNNEWVAVLPSHWKMDRIQVKYDSIVIHHSFANDVLCFNYKKITGNKVTIKKTSLPSVFINTESGKMDSIDNSPDHTYGETGYMTIINNGHKEFDGPIKNFQGRGNSTWSSSKKPYNLTTNKACVFLGLKKSKRFCFLSNPDDRSNLRNWIVYDIARKIDIPYTVGQAHVSLFLNGKYNGVYLITNKIGVNKYSVNIPELNKGIDTREVNWIEGKDNTYIKGNAEFFTPSDISGPYLIDGWCKYDTPSKEFISSQHRRIVIKSPKQVNRDEVLYIKNYYDQMENAIMSPKGINDITGLHYSQYINVNSFAWSYIFNELFGNYDTTATYYMYKYPDHLEGGKFYAGPLWDYGYSIGRSTSRQIPSCDFFIRCNYIEGRWGFFPLLWQHEDFRNTVDSLFKICYPVISSYIHTDKFKEYLLLIDRENSIDNLAYSSWNLYENTPKYLVNYINRKKEALYKELVLKPTNEHSIFLITKAPLSQENEFKIKHDSLFVLPQPYSISDSVYFSGWIDERGNKVSSIRAQKDSRFYATWKKKDFSFKQRLKNKIYKVFN